MTRRSLLIIVSDVVSDWVRKGEIVDRYFNPGDVFDHIDLLLTNGDQPSSSALQRMAGRATIDVHNLAAPRWLFAATAGWRPRLLRPYGAPGVRLAARLRPDLVRCYGIRLNAYLGARIRQELGIPLVVSVHSDPDTAGLRSAQSTLARRIAGRLVETIERFALRNADIVLPVYETVLLYLARVGVERVALLYNAVGLSARIKTSWELDGGACLRALNVANQDAAVKDVRPVIDAVASVPGVELHVVGDGPLHDDVVAHAGGTGAADRFTFTRSLPNDDVVALMAESDVFLYRSAANELSKAVMEAALTGLPIIVSAGDGRVPELQGDHVVSVDGSAASFADALRRLAVDVAERERLGRAARAYALDRWDPATVEATAAGIYRDLLDR